MMSNLNFNGVTSAPDSNDSSKVTLTRKCPWCLKEHSITVDSCALADGCAAYNRGAHMQDAFPSFSCSEREFLMTGICDTCWEKL